MFSGGKSIAVCVVLAALLAALPAGAQTTLGKEHIRQLLAGKTNAPSHGARLLLKDRRLGLINLETTIDPRLQKEAERLLQNSKSRHGALVVMEAETGKVLALAGMSGRRLNTGVALRAEAPAASLFKVVTAAAVLEETNLCPTSKLAYAGRPHTLYRYQLRKNTKRKERKVTLAESFADSNNPVFARLGIYQLGLGRLRQYAIALGFERDLCFDLPMDTSRLGQADDLFGIGELASGYHRHTTTSVLHAAVMVASFNNGGRLVEPYLVTRAVGAGGEILYLGGPKSSGRMFSDDTCRDMRKLMRATVSEGTARRAFRKLYRDKVLKHVDIGGKTGTLRGVDRKDLYEWFAGYGRHTITGRTLVVATLAGHGKVRYLNPKRLARRLLQVAFESEIKTSSTAKLKNKGGSKSNPTL